MLATVAAILAALMRNLVALTFVVGLHALPAFAQLPKLNVGGPTPTSTVAVTEEAIQAAQSALTEQEAELQKARAAAIGAVVEIIDDQISSIDRLELLYARQISAIRETQHQADLLSQARSELDALRGGSTAAEEHFSLLKVDAKRDEVDALTRTKTTAEAALSAAQSALSQSKRLYEEAEAKRREARDKIVETASPEERAIAVQKASLSEMRSRVAAEIVIMRELEVRRERLVVDVQTAKLELEQARLQAMETRVRFTAEEHAELRAELEARHAALASRIEAAAADVDEAEKQWVKDRQKLELSTVTDIVLGERVEARAKAYAVAQAEAEMLRMARQRIDDEKRIWERRFALAAAQSTPADEIAWADDARVAIEQFEREEELLVARLADLRSEALALSERLSDMEDEDPQLRWLEAQRDALARLNEVHTEQLAEVSRLLRLLQRLGAQLNMRADTRSLAERLDTVRVILGEAWSYELTSIDDESITVGKLFIVLLLLTLGLRLARILSRAIAQRLLPRLGVNPAAAAALESVIFYVAIVVVVLFALQVVNIPLTVFTFVGGAVAIGIGFGSQNIVNNFISGLILLAERPISVGDMVQVDGTLGTIDRIGPRSTRVRTFENTHVLIPNSYFLESRFVNWTLSDDVYRSKVSVGVAYGSKPRQVAKLLLEAAKGVPHIQTWPEPWVRFNDFGDNALLFSLQYFVKPLSEVWAVDSEVRYRIEEILSEAGIDIAFPQRDLHFSNRDPLRIEVVSDKPAAKS